MATSRQDDEFISAIMPSTLLDDSIDWIGRHLNPDDVFAKHKLEAWAEENGYTKE